MPTSSVREARLKIQWWTNVFAVICKEKGKVPPYSLLSVGPGADPDVQAVSPQVTLSHPLGGRLPLLSTGPAFTFPAEERHRPSAGTKLYCLVTEAHACEQLAQGCYLEADRPRFEPTTFWITSKCSTVTPHKPLQWSVRKVNGDMGREEHLRPTNLIELEQPHKSLSKWQITKDS